ncbi:hypothetical protein V6N13_059018 [Hibiscus sabdariffa]
MVKVNRRSDRKVIVYSPNSDIVNMLWSIPTIQYVHLYREDKNEDEVNEEEEDESISGVSEPEGPNDEMDLKEANDEAKEP